jgi:hypothetical protein
MPLIDKDLKYKQLTTNMRAAQVQAEDRAPWVPRP